MQIKNILTGQPVVLSGRQNKQSTKTRLFIAMVLLLFCSIGHAQLSDDKYYLEVAKVTLGSGNDNKDKGAKLIVKLYVNDGTRYQFQGYWLDNFTDELKKWQYWSNSLPRAPKFDEHYNTLALYKKYGIALEIWYDSHGGPFPLTDAWKLDKVSVDLRFFDYTGQTHPVYGNLHIDIPNSGALFTNRTCLLKLSTDGNFKPLAPVIKKDCNNF